jgi:activator of 2-hydroxyglutaryl-CoA dehydratase
MMLVDAGTAYTKVFEDGEVRVYRSDQTPADLRVHLATGYNAARFASKTVNELVALARGGEVMIENPDFTLVDVGCRDIKRVTFKNGRYAGCGWNDSCGSMTGFTLELLGRYFDLDFAAIETARSSLSFTCGIFGMSEMFDRIYGGLSAAEAVAQLIKGLTDRVYEFSNRPDSLYLSGGLCENPLFLKSFPCPLHPLGRSVLLRGLQGIAADSSL